MTTPVVKLSKAPVLSMNYPDCATCAVEVESDGDGYKCPTCGTYWPYDSDDGDAGTLYEEWSGETLDLPVAEDDDDVWMVAIPANQKRQRDALAASQERSRLARAAKSDAAHG